MSQGSNRGETGVAREDKGDGGDGGEGGDSGDGVDRVDESCVDDVCDRLTKKGNLLERKKLDE